MAATLEAVRSGLADGVTLDRARRVRFFTYSGDDISVDAGQLRLARAAADEASLPRAVTGRASASKIVTGSMDQAGAADPKLLA